MGEMGRLTHQNSNCCTDWLGDGIAVIVCLHAGAALRHHAKGCVPAVQSLACELKSFRRIKMRHLSLLSSTIFLLACYSAYAPGYAQPSTSPGGGPPPLAYQGGRATTGDWVTRPLDPKNCGTPDAPRSCPPMPRHPLPYFPENRHQ